MTVKQLSAGDNVESRCTKCRTVMNHTIVAIVDGKPGRVECNTCKGIHNYRNPNVIKTAPAAKASATPRKKTRQKVDTDLVAWAELSLDQKSGNAVPYSLHGLFLPDQIVNHPSFGLGKVIQIIPPNKVEVLFQEGRKLLRCG